MSVQFKKLNFLEADTHWEDWNVEKPLTISIEDGDDLANIFSSDDATVSTTREEAIAYAHLFAASPKLLKALKYARRFVKAEDVDVAFIDEAIAEAEGKKQTLAN